MTNNQEIQDKINRLKVLADAMKKDIENRTGYLAEDKLKLEAIENQITNLEAEISNPF